MAQEQHLSLANTHTHTPTQTNKQKYTNKNIQTKIFKNKQKDRRTKTDLITHVELGPPIRAPSNGLETITIYHSNRIILISNLNLLYKSDLNFCN